MRHIQLLFIFMAGMLVTGLACAVPGVTLPDTNAASTSAAQTVIAEITRSSIGETPSITLEPTATQSLTFTPELPTLTPTETQTPLPLFTATSTAPLISVSVATNCREGPGKVYNRVGALLVGETAEIYGRDPTGRYWYIRNPDPGVEFCWVWDEYATLAGSYLSVPVLTPPPTPTATATPTPMPEFSAEYAGLDSCSGWWVEIRVKNTGTMSFRSVKFEARDLVTDVVFVAFKDGFTDLDGCLKTSTKDVLSPGDEFVLSSPLFSYNPSGNKMRVDITLCTETSQKGGCVTRKINFKP